MLQSDRPHISVSKLLLQKISSQIPPGSTFAGFWNHYVVGSGIGGFAAEVSEAEYKHQPLGADLINKYQLRAVNLLTYWIDSPSRTKTEQELETCQAAKEACMALAWIDNIPLSLQLKETMVRLGNNYSMLTGGRRLLGTE